MISICKSQTGGWAGASEQARLMLRQVEDRDYCPPKRERILAWQKEQEFPVLPNPDDPDCGNLCPALKFPECVYEHIGHYREQKRRREPEGGPARGVVLEGEGGDKLRAVVCWSGQDAI